MVVILATFLIIFARLVMRLLKRLLPISVFLIE